MKPRDLLEALGGVKPRHLKSLELIYGKEPRWKRAVKATVKFAACAAAAVVTVGVILTMMFLQNRPRTPLDPLASSEPSSAPVSSQPNVEERKKTTLRVLTYGGVGNSEIQAVVKTVAKWYSDQHENVDVQVELVQEDASETEMINLKKAILTGHGPDIYLLPATYNGQQIFEDVRVAMGGGHFADITQLYESDSALKTSELQPQIMEAGVLGDKRYVLPLGFDVPMVFANEAAAFETGIDFDAIESEGIDALYREAENSQDASAIFAAWNAPRTTKGLNLFPELFDYDSRTVLLTEEQISSQLYYHHQAAQVAKHQPPDGYGADTVAAFYSADSLTPYETGRTMDVRSLAGSAEIMGLTKYTGTQMRVFPLRSMDGTLVANVTYWGALDAHCENVETAYDFLRLFLTPQVQFGVGFGEDYGTSIHDDASIGWPVRVIGSAQAMWELSCENAAKAAETSIDDMDGETLSSAVPETLASPNPCGNGQSWADWIRENLAPVKLSGYDFPWEIDRVRFANIEIYSAYEDGLNLAEQSDWEADYKTKAGEMVQRLGSYLEYALQFQEEVVVK